VISVDRQEGHGNAEVALADVQVTRRGQRFREQGKGELSQDPSAITRAGVSTDAATVRQIDESGEGTVDNLT
jgi:hypothetical protein